MNGPAGPTPPNVPSPHVPSPPEVPPAPGEAWTVLRMMTWSGKYLEERGVERGRLDAEHLLADLLECGRLDLYLQYDRPLTADELSGFKKRLLRRAAREPLQYVLGRAAFRGLDLHVDPRVLIPRPETEELVEVVLEWAGRNAARNGLRALDVGTGSGAIALSLAAEGPFAAVVATDPSAGALEVARLNLETSGIAVPVDFRKGAGYDPVAAEETGVGGRFDVIVSNPPYVTEEEVEALAPEIREWEPEGALLAGPEGLDVLAVLVEGAAAHLAPRGLLALETGAAHAGRVAEMIEAVGGFAPARIVRDLAGRNRIVLAELRSRKVRDRVTASRN